MKDIVIVDLTTKFRLAYYHVFIDHKTDWRLHKRRNRSASQFKELSRQLACLPCITITQFEHRRTKRRCRADLPPTATHKS